MSHAATHWLATVPPTEITNGEFRVLFHLCDCHNPSRGCYPSQAYLMEHTGLSNGGLNKALGALEDKRLIRRERQADGKTKRRKSTLYILGCDEDLTQKPSPVSGVDTNAEHQADPSPLSGDGANSTFDAKPSPLLAQSHLHPSGDKPVKEPVIEPVCAAGAANTGFSDFFEKYPRPGDLEKTEEAYEAVLAEGISHPELMAAVRRYCDENRENIGGNQRQYLKYSDSWLTDRYFERYRGSAAEKPTNPDVILEQRAKFIRDGHSWVGRHVSAASARELISRGLVTVEQCRAVGIAL